jgi:periodic tryptophan protein 1
MSGTLISSLAWVPRGRAALQPRKYELDESELERVGKLGGPGVLEQLKEQMMEMEQDDGEWEDMGDDAGDDDEDEEDDDAKMDEGEDKPVKPSDPNDMSTYKMDEYDDEESGSAGGLQWRGALTLAMGAFANVKGLSYYRTNEEDPYITLKEDDEEMEREELALLATDSMIVTARTTADLSGLDFHVYDDANESLYTHHDLMLPAFPLCVEWLDFPTGSSESTATGNYIAVGSFDPSIEIWDCDVVDGLYPQAILGPAGSLEKPQAKPKGTGKKKRKQMVQPAANAEHHVQPVLTLSWTPRFRNLLLSGSADATVKLWDLTRESPMGAQSSWDKIHGGEKVQAVEWNRGPAGSGADSAVLSGGWDRTVRVWDAKSKDGEGYKVSVGADIECVRWDPWDATSFYVSKTAGDS